MKKTFENKKKVRPIKAQRNVNVLQSTTAHWRDVPSSEGNCFLQKMY